MDRWIDGTISRSYSLGGGGGADASGGAASDILRGPPGGAQNSSRLTGVSCCYAIGSFFSNGGAIGGLGPATKENTVRQAAPTGRPDTPRRAPPSSGPPSNNCFSNNLSFFSDLLLSTLSLCFFNLFLFVVADVVVVSYCFVYACSTLNEAKLRHRAAGRRDRPT